MNQQTICSLHRDDTKNSLQMHSFISEELSSQASMLPEVGAEAGAFSTIMNELKEKHIKKKLSIYESAPTG